MTDPFFVPVDPKVKLPAVEQEVLDFWQRNDTFGASLEATRGKEPYAFYDGPPFATGLPHYGHLLAGTLKDIVPRYWTMRGHYVERRFGWDCHGLPVENEMEQELKVSGRRDIEKLGVDIFNEACRSIVLRYTQQWERVVHRMGRWVDFVRQYRTMDPPYMESIWWVFSQVWEKGLIRQGFCVQPYCPRCATPLSSFEVNEGYRDVDGPSITVTFPLADDPATKLLVWTTTPWTLPSNVAIAAGPDVTYVKVRDGEDYFILAKERLGAYYRKDSDYTLVEEMPGSALAGMRYKPLFGYFADRSEELFAVTEADFVSIEDGTGLVHIAPAFGEDDYEVGKKLNLPLVCPVDEEGKFTDEVPEYEGKLVFDADEDIIRRIKKMGRLVHRSTEKHRYPFCYRCDTPLIYKAITAWFMEVEPLKPNMLENNQRIHWVPDHLRDGRFGKAIEGAPPWNISRNRYWGTPLPLWLCECGHRECVGSLEQLHRLVGKGDQAAGAREHSRVSAEVAESVRTNATQRLAAFDIDVSWAKRIETTHIDQRDIHRHIVDRLNLYCPACAAVMARTPEVLDCWFESGAMPYAQNHYPFENRELFEKSFPADFIAEGLDQTRGWFNKLTVLASALFGKEAFKNVVVNGIILAEDGKKLSKRLKNYTPPEEILEKLGADALRLFLINSPAVKAEDLRFSEKGVTEMARSVLLPYWNAYSFFVTYANVDGFRPPAQTTPQSSNELDRWIVSLLNNVVSSVNSEMELYNLYRVVPLLVDFIDNLTNWYIRRSRRRFWKSENDTDKNDAYATLYYVLTTFARAMAPFLPFLTEAIYRNLTLGGDRDSRVSVHLQPYPEADTRLIDRDLETKMALVRRSVTMGRALRSRYTIKTRQPLAEFTVVIRDEHKRELLSDMQQLIAEELNVKAVTFSPNEDDVVSLSAKPNYKRLGAAYGPKMREAAKTIEQFSRDDIERLLQGGTITVLDHELSYEDIQIRRTKHEGVEVETEGDITVALNTEITDELLNEGIAREFVNRIQNIRKRKDLEVTDRITIRCTSPKRLQQAVAPYAEYVSAETLATDLQWTGKTEGDIGEPIEVNGIEATVIVERAS